MAEQADSELVASARAGNKAAFGVLVERYQALACRVARRMVASEELARELTQEALLEAYLSLAHLRDDARFKSWLCGIVLNLCRNYIRNQRINYFSLEAMAGGLAFDAIPFETASPQELAEERELHRVVLAAVNALSPAEHEATLLFYYDQLTLREVAAALGISVVAVKGRLYKARQHLRVQLLPQVADAQTERRRKMIQVTIADVVKHERTEADGTSNTFHLVVLLDEAGRRFLPIWVGPWEGQSIALGIQEFAMPRPMTYNFIASLLDAAGAKLEEVRVQTLNGDTFYAMAQLRVGDGVREVDARPSDAIALAVRTGSPIYVAADVLDKAGVTLPADVSPMPARNGAASIMQELAGAHSAFLARPKPSQAETAKTRADTEAKLIAQVFGRPQSEI